MKELGIEPVLLLAQIINFSILFFLLKKFLYKPMRTFLDKRKKEIEDGLALSQKLKKEEERLKERQDELLSQAKKDAKAIVDQAKKQLELQKKEILEQAHKEALVVVAKAKEQAKREAASAKEASVKDAVLIAHQMVMKLIPEVLSEESHKKLLTSRIKELEKSVGKIH